MEATLIYESINGCREIFSRWVQKEQIQDCVVPDTFPDIDSLIVTTGTPLIRSKDVAFGRIRIEANIPARCAFYGENGEIFCLDVNLPFYFNMENEQIGDDCRVVAELCTETLETRLLNPRKISVRAVLNVGVTAYAREERRIPVGVEPSEAKIHVLRKNAKITGISDVTEKTFVVTDEVPVPDEQSVSELLGWQVSLHSAEIRTVGTKAVIKGSAESRILYRTADGGLSCSAFTTDFSQVAELNAACSAPLILCRLLPSGQYYEILPGSDGRKIGLELHLVAELTVYEETEISCLADAYSNLFRLELQRESMAFFHAAGEVRAARSLRVSVPLPEVPTRVVGHMAEPVSEKNGDTGADRTLRTKVLWTDREGRLHSSVQMSDCGSGGEDGDFLVSDISFPSVSVGESAEGIAVAIEAEISGYSFETVQAEYVSAVSVAEDESLHPEEQPSLVLIRRNGEPDLWTLAKENCSTAEAIEKANPDKAEGGHNLFLLIPRSI